MASRKRSGKGSAPRGRDLANGSSYRALTTLPALHDLVDPDVFLSNESVLELHDDNLAVLSLDLKRFAVFKDSESVVFVNDGQGWSHVVSPVERDTCTHHLGRGWSTANVRIVRPLTIGSGISRAGSGGRLAIAHGARGGYLNAAYRR